MDNINLYDLDTGEVIEDEIIGRDPGCMAWNSFGGQIWMVDSGTEEVLLYDADPIIQMRRMGMEKAPASILVTERPFDFP